MDTKYEPAKETQRIRRLLQAAVDHYPRLLAVEFSLQFPLPVIRTDLENIIPVLLSAIASLTGEYADQRQAAGKPAPPTLLRAIWGHQDRGIQMLLMLNRDTFYHPRRDKFSSEENIGEALGILPCRSSRNCFTHRVMVERPTSIALAAAATV